VDAVFSTTTNTVFPATTVITTGTLNAGAAAQLNADDNAYYRVNSALSGTNNTLTWYGSFPSVPKTLSNLKVTVKGLNSRSCTEVVSIFNWTTNAYVSLNSQAVSTTEITRGPLVPAGTFSDYVSGASGNGELRVQVSCSSTAGTITSSSDLMAIEYN
jgi:hypothetical protein